MRTRQRMALPTGVLLLVSVAVLTIAPASVASRPPTHSEKRAILRAAPSSPYPKGWASLTVRVSTVDSRWAAVYISANRGHQHQVQPDAASIYHTRRHGWVTHETGNGGGCGVPVRVSRDLHLACY
jgi:hypothetical protein